MSDKQQAEALARVCTGEDFWHSHADESMNIPPITMSDGPNGLRKQEEGADHLGIHDSISAICYPTGSALACSFDRETATKVGALLGEECRAEGVQLLLAPAINIKRTPLGGRNFEYFSEDPYLTGELAYSYITGVQSCGVGACVKHFLANNQENGRMTVDEHISKRALNEIYLKGFKRAIEAEPSAVMSSYNRVNGEYVGESHYFLTEVLRDKWNFKGMVVSDWYAVNDRVKSLKAGLDLEMPGGALASCQKLIDAVNDGTLDILSLQTSANRIASVANALNKPSTAIYDKDAHHNCAVEIAKECAVLLKNENALLPLTKKDNVLFVGESFAAFHLQGGGSSHVNAHKIGSLSKELKDYNVTYMEYDGNDSRIVKAAKDYDKIVVFTGLSDAAESEGYDRKNLDLPHNQLIAALASASANVAVVLFSGSCVEMPFANSVRAILSMQLGGEGVAEACAALLTARAIPSGRLAESYPLKLEHNPAYLNSASDEAVDYAEGVFVGYRYYTTKKLATLFPFGHGLSYTQFEYSNLSVTKNDDSFTVTVDVKNIGKYAAKEVVQLYIAPPRCSVDRPAVELKRFEKIHLNRNEKKTISFSLHSTDFAYFDETIDDFFTESGDYDILISKSAENHILSASVHVDGDERKIELSDNTTLAQLAAHPKTSAFVSGLLSRFDNELSRNMALNAPLRLIKGAAKMTEEGYNQFKQVIKSLLEN